MCSCTRSVFGHAADTLHLTYKYAECIQGIEYTSDHYDRDGWWSDLGYKQWLEGYHGDNPRFGTGRESGKALEYSLLLKELGI